MTTRPHLASAALLAGLALVPNLRAETFTVTDIDPDAPGGLRTLVTNAPQPGPHRIEFNIPGPGPHVITLDNGLFFDLDLEIDGYSQPGSRPNASATGFDADLRIVLEVVSVLFPDPHTLVDGNVTIRGIEFRGVSSSITAAGDYQDILTVRGCRFHGAVLQGGPGEFLAGGPSPPDRNHFVAAGGVLLLGTAATVQGNLFEADVSAGFATPNALTVDGAFEPILIQDNLFLRLPGRAVKIRPHTDFPGPMLIGNRFVENAGLAIDVDPPGPTLNDPGDTTLPVNFPLLTGRQLTSTEGQITGRLDGAPDTLHTVELYASATCDPSGFGEGETALGTISVTTDSAGAANFTFQFDGDHRGAVFTALATSPRGTSEFSACLGPAGAVEIPTLSTWMLLLLAAGLAGLGFTVLARPRH